MSKEEIKPTDKKKKRGGILSRNIGAKLSLIIGITVISSLLIVTFMTSNFMGDDVKITAEDNNRTLNSRSAASADVKLTNIRSNVFQLLDLINAAGSGSNAAIARQAQSFFFERNSDVAFIAVQSLENIKSGDIAKTSSTDLRFFNNHFFSINELENTVVDDFLSANTEDLERSCLGETIALNASPYFNIPVISLLFPYTDNGTQQTCVIIFSVESLSEAIGSGSGSTTSNTSFVINNYNDILLHPDGELVLAGAGFSNHPLVQQLRQNNDNNTSSFQTLFEMEEDGKKERYYGAYERLSIGDIVVLTTVPEKVVLEMVERTKTTNIRMTLLIFFISIPFMLFFAHLAISKPLKILTAAAEDISRGNFNTEIIDSLNKKRKDEIGVLNQGTADERDFLNTFAKFTNQGVAKAIATKSIDFEPHLKDCTIFFSDIRGFTKISDGFKDRFGNESAAEIIGFLNDYMGRMVNCVSLSHGNIDKFEGDAIMGVWGLLREDNLDYEKLPDTDLNKAKLQAEHEAHVKGDAVDCIRGIISMRYALMEYNKAAEEFTKLHAGEPKAKYKPHIQIGCGINTGRVTAGVMGGGEKMEYTAIGDAVNFASRTESTNKPCGTDILITEDTYNLLKMDFIRCQENHFTIPAENMESEILVERIPVGIEVKGKGEQHFYGVVNMPNFDIEKFFRGNNPDFKADPDCLKAVGPTGPKTLNEVRTLLGIPIPDFAKVNLNEEENKTVIKQ
ncbi:MAG: adenylate/guanylate cyclase domain-containing protein [Treponema sp.]|nr:adenylate/guanylate cyclase domain-containing protein [Treponema sp.]